ncbi:MAG: domain S-box protein [Proteobacteria bacterium]|nr:domain S-box protein [Pseudomonadota bacterium]
MLLLFVIGLVMMAGIHVWSGREAMLDEKKLKTQHLVQTAISVLQHYQSLETGQQLSRPAAQEAAKQAIKDMRYGAADYFWINDARDPVMIMHPVQPALNGQRLDVPFFDRVSSIQRGIAGPVQVTDGKVNMGRAFNAVANEAGGGFVTYAWPKQSGLDGGESVLYPKLSYVEKFSPWEWVVGSGIFIDDVEEATRTSVLHYLALISLGGTLLGIVVVALANSVIRPLTQSTRLLTAMSHATDSVGPLPIEREDEIGALIEGYNRLQAALQEREARLRLAASVVENVLEGIVVADQHGRIISVNAAFSRLTGYPAGEVVGCDVDALCAQEGGSEPLAAVWGALQEGQSWDGEWLSRCKDGHHFVAHASIVPVCDGEHRIHHYIVVLQDITEQKRLTELLRDQAHTDSLTGLANRRYFLELASRELNRLERYEGELALAMLDLDHFKQINDSYGHAVGDQVLQTFAAVCRRMLRDTDLIGRVGGEEFAIIFTRTNAGEAYGVAERLREEVAATRVRLDDGREVGFSVSLGIAERHPGERDLEAILKRADAALFQAKSSGRNQACVAEP